MVKYTITPNVYKLMLFAVIIITIIVILLIVICKLKKMSYICKFVNKAYMASIIDVSPFFTRMNKYDLIVRRVQSEDEYKVKYLNSIRNFTCKQKKKLCELVYDANVVLERYKNINTIEWKFAKLANGIENNWPHTLGDTIMLHDVFFEDTRDNMIRTLIHEKLHLYQRVFTNYTNILVSLYLGYKYHGDMTVIDNIMNNPDLDGKLYTVKGQLLYRGYDRPYPSSLHNTKLYEVTQSKSANMIEYSEISPKSLQYPDFITQVDHPYEIMAQLVSHQLTGNNMSFPNINKWIILYL